MCDKTCIFFFFPIINKYFLMAKRSLFSRCPSYDRYDAIRRCIAETIHSDDTRCFSVNIVSDDEDIVVIWWMKRRSKKVVKRRRYWVYLYFNRSGEIVSVVMRELEQNRERFTSFYDGRHNEVQFRSCLNK